MSTLLQELVQIDATITADAAAEVRTTLVAISYRLQEESGSSADSLQAWGQWLDDEGYDRDSFAAVLRRISTARVGEQDLDALIAFGHTIEAEADGIPKLLDHLHSHHPQLAEELEAFEGLALAEEQELQSTAGGMSKAGRDTLIAVGSAGGVALTGYIGYKAGSWAHRKYKAWKEGAAAANLKQNEKAMSDRAEQNVNEALKAHSGAIEERASHAGKEGIKEASKDPMKAFEETKMVLDNKKSILQYTEDDIETRAQAMLGAHIRQFPESIGREVGSRVERDVRTLPKYKEKLKEFAKQSEGYDENLLTDIVPSEAQKIESELASEFEKGDWFKDAVHNIWQSKGTPYRAEVTRDIRLKYKGLVTDEVTAAQDAARKKADNEFYKILDAEGVKFEEQFIASEVKVTENILESSKDAVKKAEREAETVIIDTESLA